MNSSCYFCCCYKCSVDRGQNGRESVSHISSRKHDNAWPHTTAQAVHRVAPGAALYVPAAHAVQDEAPVASELYAPTAQEVHTDTVELAATLPYVPALHAPQAPVAHPEQYWPGAQTAGRLVWSRT